MTNNYVPLLRVNMTIEKVKHNGALIISDIIDGYLVSKTYYGYTKKEAIKLFRSEYLTI